MTAYGKTTTWVILASATMVVMAGAVIAPVLDLMREGLGVDPGAARLLITTHSIFIALLSPLYGILIDKIGPKKPFVFGLVFIALSGGTGLFINDYWLLLASRAFLGIGAAAIFTSITVLILNLYRQGTERNRVMGWRASGQSAGGIMWPLLGGFLGTFSWHYPFAVYLIGIPLGILAVLYIPEIHQEPTNPGNGEKTTLVSIFREHPILFGLYLYIFLSSVYLYGVVIFLPDVLKTLGIASSMYVGLYISGMSLMAAISSLAYGKFKARLSHKTIIMISLGLSAVGFALLSQSSTSWLVALSLACFGFGQGMAMPTVQLWTGELVPASFRGRITSYLGSFGLGGQFLSPIILSPLESSLGLNAVFIIIAATSALVLVSFLVMIRSGRS